MNNNKKIKFSVDKQTIRMIIAGFVCFAGVLLFSDFAGFFRTLPWLMVCGFVCEKIKVSIRFCTATTLAMNLFLCFVNQRTILDSISLSAFSVLLLAGGMYVCKLFEILKNTDKKTVKNKCVRYSVVVVFAVLVLNFFVCGNPVSYVLEDSTNTKYISQNYKEEIQKKYTLYSPANFEYRTYIEFEDEEIVVGRDNESFVCIKGEKVKDGYRDYFEQKMVFYASRSLSSCIAQATDAFEITASDIAFEKGEILDKSDSFEEYSYKTGYVVSLYSILEKEADFLSIVKDCVSALNKNDAEFSEIIFCGGNAHEVLFGVSVTPDMTPSDLENCKLDFDEKTVRKFGVTEKTILDYWLNL